MLHENKEEQAVTLLKNIPLSLLLITLYKIISSYQTINDPEQTFLKKVIHFVLPFLLTEDPGVKYITLERIIELFKDKNIPVAPHEFVAQQVATLDNPQAYKEIIDELIKLEKTT